MPLHNAGQSMIRAYEMGLMERRAAQDQEAEQERKKIEMDLLKHRVQQMKLEERIQTWDLNVKGAQAKAKSLEGLPAAEMPAEMRPGLPASDLSQVIAGLMPSGRAAAALPQVTPVGSVAANQPLPLPQGIEQPGLSIPESGINIPGITLRPRSEEQIIAKQTAAALREAAIKDQTETKVLSHGQKLWRGGKVIAEGGVDPADVETARKNKAQEQIDRDRLAFDKLIKKEGLSEATRVAVEEIMARELQELERDAGPDPVAMTKYQSGLLDSEPKPRLTPIVVNQRKLAILNSYRAKMKLPTLSRLPKDWGGPGEPLLPAHGPMPALPPVTSAKQITMAHIAAVARKNGTTVAQETQRAKAEGFTIVR